MLTLAIALAAAQPGDDPVGLEVTRDPITDRVSAMATFRGDRAVLAIGCDPTQFRGVRVTLRSRYWLARENFITGTRAFSYRFDRGRAWRSRWDTSGRLGWMDERRETNRFIGQARLARRLVIRAVDVEGRKLDLAFPMAGASRAIDEALALCAGRLVPVLPS